MNPTPELTTELTFNAASTIDFIVVLLCAGIGMMLKSFQRFKNDFIPFTLMVFGAVLFSLLAKKIDPLIIKAGMTAGLTAVGGHQLLMRSKEAMAQNKNEKTET